MWFQEDALFYNLQLAVDSARGYAHKEVESDKFNPYSHSLLLGHFPDFDIGEMNSIR